MLVLPISARYLLSADGNAPVTAIVAANFPEGQPAPRAGAARAPNSLHLLPDLGCPERLAHPGSVGLTVERPVGDTHRSRPRGNRGDRGRPRGPRAGGMAADPRAVGTARARDRVRGAGVVCWAMASCGRDAGQPARAETRPTERWPRGTACLCRQGRSSRSTIPGRHPPSCWSWRPCPIRSRRLRHLGGSPRRGYQASAEAVIVDAANVPQDLRRRDPTRCPHQNRVIRPRGSVPNSHNRHYRYAMNGGSFYRRGRNRLRWMTASPPS